MLLIAAAGLAWVAIDAHAFIWKVLDFGLVGALGALGVFGLVESLTRAHRDHRGRRVSPDLGA
jgi:hypothetical protein